MFTASFSTDKACELIAQLIDKARNLCKCNIIQNDENDRRVIVDVKFANFANGSISVKAKDRAITTIPTTRTAEQAIEII